MAIGTLTVGVAANASKGIAGLKSFRSHVKGTKDDCNLASKSVAGMGSIITRFGVQLGGAMAAYASVRTFKTIADDLDSLGEQAERLSIVPQRLQELRYAGQLTGVQTDLLDKSVGRLNLNIAKAATGTGAGVKSLDELGVTIADLNAQSPDQQFRTIADALQGVASQSDKARIATTLFGKEGRTLLPTLDLGAQGLGRMAAESRKLQGVITADEINKVAKFNDELDRLSMALGSVGRELVIDVAPAASKLLSDLREAVQYMRDKESKGGGWLGAAKNAAGGALGMLYGEGTQGWLQKQYGKLGYFSDSGSAGQLTQAEQNAQALRENRFKSRRAWETSTDPNVVAQRAAHNQAGAASRRYGQAFNDNTVGAASSAIGSGFAGFTSLMGQMRQQGERFEKFVKSRPSHLNPLTGLAPLGMSAARKAYMAGEGSKPGQSMGLAGGVRGINALIEADSSEGYMALRANQRQLQPSRIDKAAPKLEANTDRSAKAAEQLLEFFRRIPAPRSA
jgi:hypothetical protein